MYCLFLIPPLSKRNRDFTNFDSIASHKIRISSFTTFLSLSIDCNMVCLHGHWMQSITFTYRVCIKSKYRLLTTIFIWHIYDYVGITDCTNLIRSGAYKVQKMSTLYTHFWDSTHFNSSLRIYIYVCVCGIRRVDVSAGGAVIEYKHPIQPLCPRLYIIYDGAQFITFLAHN